MWSRLGYAPQAPRPLLQRHLGFAQPVGDADTLL